MKKSGHTVKIGDEAHLKGYDSKFKAASTFGGGYYEFVSLLDGKHVIRHKDLVEWEEHV